MIANRVHATLDQHRMVQPGERVLLAVSGGSDSVAMTHILVELQGVLEVDFAVAHLDHGLRDGSREDVVFCRALAESLGLPFASARVDIAADAARPGRTLEEEARAQRYAFLDEKAEELDCQRIAVGHTLEDQAETLLMRMLRGAGATGLGAMRPVSEGGRFPRIRPLLDTRRADLQRYLETRELPWREDETNRDLRFTRNRLRHETLPALAAAYNPSLMPTLGRTARIFQLEDTFLQDAAERAYANVASERAGGVELAVPALRELHPALQRRLVLLALAHVRADSRDISHGHVEDVLALTTPGRSGREAHLPRVVAERSFDKLWLTARSGTDEQNRLQTGYNVYEYRLSIPSTLPIRESRGVLTACFTERPLAGEALPAAAGNAVILSVDPSEVAARRLLVRSPRAGDRFRPIGAPGSKSLARYLMERKVAKRDRGTTPLIVQTSTEGRDEILWVAGHAISETARIRPEDGRAGLRVEWKAP